MEIAEKEVTVICFKVLSSIRLKNWYLELLRCL